MDLGKPPTSRLAKRAQAAGLTPIVVPVVKSPYALSNSGTYTEGDFQIGADGLKLGMDNLQISSSADSRSGDASTSRQADWTSDEGAFTVALGDLAVTGTIGAGSSGTVHKAIHKPTGTSYALKIIQMNVQEQTRKNIIQELRTLHQSYCKQVVALHGAFFKEGSISIVLECMDGGSVSDLLRATGAVHERHLRYVAHQVLLGLKYLHRELRVIHRDIKPSNVLVSYRGDVKISDFGVSGQLSHSVAKCQTWVGTVTYMSPERIRGGLYSFDSDCWSLGLSLLECATGHFPYCREDPDAEPLSFWDLLDCIIERDPPKLSGGFSPEFSGFVDACLQTDPKDRADVDRLLAHPWVAALHPEGALLAAEAAAFAEAVRGADGAKREMEADLEKEKEWSREEYVEAPVRRKSGGGAAAAGGAGGGAGFAAAAGGVPVLQR